MTFPAVKTVKERIAEIEAKRTLIEHPYPSQLMTEIWHIQNGIFLDTVNLMLDVVRGGAFWSNEIWDSILRIEEKIGMSNSTDPRSIDYRLRRFEHPG